MKVNDIHLRLNQTGILSNISLEASKGEMLAVVGPNGAGKSSLLSLLANEIHIPERKKITLKGKLLSEWGIQDLAVHKAKFSQYYANDLPLLVKDVVMMGRYPYFDAHPSAKDHETVEQAMTDADILRMAERDYNTLSGGEKQRVHLARAFVQLENDTEEKILFLDEPLNNLDVRHQYQTMKWMQAFARKGNMIIVVLHDLNLAAKFADRILLMNRGKVVSSGKPEEVFCPRTIADVYGFPCTVCKNPVSHEPLILFG